MTKIMTGFWFLMTVLIGVGTYWVSHEVERLERRYAAIQSDILDEQESIHVFQAEWSYLNSPARIEKLAREYLKLDQIQPLQMASIDTIPTDTDARRYRLDKFGEAVAYMPAPRDRPNDSAYDEASENLIIDGPSVGIPAPTPDTGDKQ
jgi:cell division protein FtsL|tara:strand:+ start:112080 stop:112526 length:447 start_codon:yes stop_codon:yes gene_type:complete